MTERRPDQVKTGPDPEMRVAYVSRGAPFAGSVADYLCSLLPDAGIPRDERSVVYFVGSDHGPIKIGSTVDPANRLKHLRCGSPLPLKILAAIPGGIALETAYHKAFGLHRLHGEWFERVPHLMSEIRHWRAKKRRLSCVDD